MWFKAFLSVTLAWGAAIFARVIIAIAMLVIAILVAVFMIFYGTNGAARVIETLTESLKKYRI